MNPTLQLNPTELDSLRQLAQHTGRTEEELVHDAVIQFLHRAAESWDAQISLDIAAGKLDSLADEALRDVRANRTTARR